MTSAQSSRTRGDMCPGVLRPWFADDGLLVRLRLVGGHVSGSQLRELFEVAELFGDGEIHLTARANLQVRGLGSATSLHADVISAFEATGLLPSRSHELVRNILMSPQSGVAGGRADLRPVAAELDRLLLADPVLGTLPGRFLFVLDDGRGDLLDRRCDLGVVALDHGRGQLRVGEHWSDVMPLEAAASHLVALARRFLSRRGDGPAAAWHVRELADPLVPLVAPDVDLPREAGPLAFGRVEGGTHHEISRGVLTRPRSSALLDESALIVTPWRGIFVPDPREQQ